MAKRLSALFLVVVLLASIVPFRLAYANGSGTIADPKCDPVWSSADDYMVYSVSNQFDATLVLLDMWYVKIQLTSEMFTKLSNEVSGGDFYDLAQKFRDGNSTPPWADPLNNFLGASTWNSTLATVRALVASNAEDYVWWLNASQAEINDAKRALQTILDGGSLGPSGGGSSGSITSMGGGFGYYNGGIVNLNSQYVFGNANGYYTNAKGAFDQSVGGYTLAKLSPSLFFSLNVTGTAWDDFFSLYPLDSYVYCLNVLQAYYQRLSTARLYAVRTSDYAPVMGSNGDDGQRILAVTSITSAPYIDLGTSFYTFDGSTFVVNSNKSSYSVYYDNPSANVSGQPTAAWFTSASGGPSGGGDNHWPDPVPPDPPDPRDPGPEPDPPDPGPGIELPDIDFPDIDIDLPSVTINEPANTTSADYTPWLRAILQALNQIIEDMGTHCDHIKVAIWDYLEDFAVAMNDALEYFYDDLVAYLGELAEWMVDHMNWDINVQSPDVNVPGYDDSGVIGWLRKIFYKIPGTTTTPRPDPVQDTEGALDWWAQLLQWIANALSGFVTDFVGDIGDILSGVLTKFPFSIPWDIMAYLALLDAERATPVVTFTIPAISGWWSSFEITIDLRPYDLAMSTVRGMILIWWGFVLIMRTDWILLVMGRTGSEIATGFVHRLTGNGGAAGA